MFNCEFINTYQKQLKSVLQSNDKHSLFSFEFIVLIMNTYSQNFEIFKLFLVFRVDFDTDPNPNVLGFGSGVKGAESVPALV